MNLDVQITVVLCNRHFYARRFPVLFQQSVLTKKEKKKIHCYSLYSREIKKKKKKVGVSFLFVCLCDLLVKIHKERGL